MPEPMRLQKYLAQCGIASRRAAEELIALGRVTVNGKVICTAGEKIIPGRDMVTVDGKPVRSAEKPVYIMLNKPRGYVTTVRDEQGRKTVMDLLPAELGRIYPVGRLDFDTEGLLLLTNDGNFTHRLTHPSHEISKTYLVKILGLPSPEALKALRTGVMLEGRKTHPAEVLVKHREIGSAVLVITIHEGRNRQVRKMCAAVGHKVVFLRRIAEGSVRLGDLPIGAWRHLTADEVTGLGGNPHADN
ncbi:MAG: rRNA pseudouridine synthase [Ruminococcaceae bacterium]|nr:rRNA pseudouridine synthase [Oscillospiraceae bacterium]